MATRVSTATDLVSFAETNRLSGPRFASDARLKEKPDDPEHALDPRSCRCERPTPMVDEDTGETLCFKCGRRRFVRAPVG